MECKCSNKYRYSTISNSFILTIWNVNPKKPPMLLNPFFSFILTIWNVNLQYLQGLQGNIEGFILTIWNVNTLPTSIVGLKSTVLY